MSIDADRLNEIRAAVAEDVHTASDYEWARDVRDLLAVLDAAEQRARLNEQGYPHGISWREHEGRWYLELHRDGWDIEISFGEGEEPGVWIVPHDKPDEPVYDSERAEQRAVQAEQERDEAISAGVDQRLRAEAAEARAERAEQQRDEALDQVCDLDESYTALQVRCKAAEARAAAAISALEVVATWENGSFARAVLTDLDGEDA